MNTAGNGFEEDKIDQVPEHRCDSPHRRDSGFSFVETVVTIVLLGVMILPILDAVRTSVRASSVSRSAAQVETAVVNAADRINRAPLSCDYTIYAQASVQTQGWPPGQATVAHEWYDSGSNSWKFDGDGCQFAAPTDDLVQKVSISITSPDGKVTRSIQVVKSNV